MENKRSLLPIILLLLLSFQNAFAQESFILNSRTDEFKPFEAKLPRGESTISMSLQLTMPISEVTVPMLVLEFPDVPERLASIIIGDEACTGEYNTFAHFKTKRGQLETRYFANKIPWPEVIDVVMEINGKSDKGYAHKITVYGEQQTIYTKEKARKLAISVFGEVEVGGFQIVKEN